MDIRLSGKDIGQKRVCIKSDTERMCSGPDTEKDG